MTAVCPSCGAGPFKRLASHMRAAHGIASRSNAEVLRDARRRKGIKARVWWTPEHDALLLERTDLSHAALAKLTGHTEESVGGRIVELRNRGVEVPRRNPSAQKAHHRQGRTLLAQTCGDCGLLLDADWFNPRGDGLTKKSSCRVCQSRKNSGTHPESYWDHQQLSLTWVRDPGREYTDAELRVLEREDIDCLEMAEILGRSYASVLGTRQRLRLGLLKPRLTEPVETWVIRPGGQPASQLEGAR